MIDIDKERLLARLRRYFDPAVSDELILREMPSAIRDASRFDGPKTRRYLVRRGLLEGNIVRFAYRPFDDRWLYWEPETKLLHEKRSEYFPLVGPDNLWIEARQRQTKPRFDRGYVTSVLADSFGAGCSSFFPLYLRPGALGASLLPQGSEGLVANQTPMALRYLESVNGGQIDLFCHVVGIIHAPAYRCENIGALRQDWPRIPLPAPPEVFRESADLGLDVGHLLDVESHVDRVTTGDIRYELRPIGPIDRTDGSQINPDAGDLAVTAGWGHAGQGGVTMPARGRLVERPYVDAEIASFREGLSDLGLTYEQLMGCLGGTCVDVYLNDLAFWRCVPKRVWTYTIGGYQVIKKWLSYRERPLLGRDLQSHEVRYVTEMARRIAAILLLEPALDANYERIKADAFDWSAAASHAEVDVAGKPSP